jgi:hypothetical protein
MPEKPALADRLHVKSTRNSHIPHSSLRREHSQRFSISFADVRRRTSTKQRSIKFVVRTFFQRCLGQSKSSVAPASPSPFAGVNPGTATLTIRQSNSVLGQYPNFRVGGTTVDVPDSTSSSRFRYETALLPGGGADNLILALDNLNHLEGFDYSASGHAPRITGGRITRIVVGSMNAISRPAVLYANDIFRDNDHDGIGYGLERHVRPETGATTLYAGLQHQRHRSRRYRGWRRGLWLGGRSPRLPQMGRQSAAQGSLC